MAATVLCYLLLQRSATMRHICMSAAAFYRVKYAYVMAHISPSGTGTLKLWLLLLLLLLLLLRV
jgi:small-conductance mechanosensitive channel